MGVTIEGVPASVPREQVEALIRELGFDPSELLSLSLQPNGIFAEVFADGRPHGGLGEKWRFTADGKDVATHLLCIPIIDEKKDSNGAVT